MIDRTSAWLMEVVEVPTPSHSYIRFAERRAMWNLLGATSDYSEMTWAEVREAAVFAGLEQQHPHRFKEKGTK